MRDLPSLNQLLKNLQQVPYLASKNIYRVANFFLTLEPHNAEQFCRAILDAKQKLVPCPLCCAWKEKEQPCLFCDDPKRDRSVICVIETWQELVTLERTEGYKGLYHVLGGAICPLEGIGPEQLSIAQFIERIAHNSAIKEIILATNQTPEGEATATFIANKLKDRNIIISCLARGMPVGSSIEFMDRITVYKALSERRPF